MQLADIELEIDALEKDGGEKNDDGPKANLPGSEKLRRRGAAGAP
jgi:hypothetical protein